MRFPFTVFGGYGEGGTFWPGYAWICLVMYALSYIQCNGERFSVQSEPALGSMRRDTKVRTCLCVASLPAKNWGANPRNNIDGQIVCRLRLIVRVAGMGHWANEVALALASTGLALAFPTYHRHIEKGN